MINNVVTNGQSFPTTPGKPNTKNEKLWPSNINFDIAIAGHSGKKQTFLRPIEVNRGLVANTIIDPATIRHETPIAGDYILKDS